ncbi:hypothetical protein DSO57_1038272 [Entomophthora muscae]|uniref:Uncharacterized protein n=1 Tax=Entomophthora muscae TaxID=34485 RepID=A0ACC2RDK4_9FUNG|nr:hypothetical protein DSO57_1038272 [Entomophthora muscae]
MFVTSTQVSKLSVGSRWELLPEPTVEARALHNCQHSTYIMDANQPLCNDKNSIWIGGSNFVDNHLAFADTADRKLQDIFSSELKNLTKIPIYYVGTEEVNGDKYACKKSHRCTFYIFFFQGIMETTFSQEKISVVLKDWVEKQEKWNSGLVKVFSNLFSCSFFGPATAHTIFRPISFGYRFESPGDTVSQAPEFTKSGFSLVVPTYFGNQLNGLIDITIN